MHEEQASADLCAGQGLAGGTQPDVTAWGKSAGARGRGRRRSRECHSVHRQRRLTAACPRPTRAARRYITPSSPTCPRLCPFCPQGATKCLSTVHHHHRPRPPRPSTRPALSSTPPPRPPHCPLSPARTRQHQPQTLRRSPRHCNGSLSATSSTHQSRRVSLTWTTTPRHSSTTAVRLYLIRLKTTSRERACWTESSAKSAEAWAGKSSCPRAEKVRVLTP